MIKKRITALTLALLALLMFGLLLFSAVNPSGTVQAAPSVAPVVNTLADENDGCAVGSCSLRDAIADATAGDTITFAVTGTIVLSPILGELTVNKNLTIDGGDVITVSGGNSVRVFNVSGGNVSIDNLTIINGKATGAGSSSVGGGIVNNGTLTVSNSLLSGNVADTSGGGIASIGSLTMIDSSLIDNVADYGGGINNGGVMTVTGSTITGNTATVDGGGINNNGGKLTVSNSTLSGNIAGDSGGGVWNYIGSLSGENMTVINSTLSGNDANDGGAIHNLGISTIYSSTLSGSSTFAGGGIFNSGTITVVNGTLSGNSASTFGGGILTGSIGTTVIQSSTISDNRAATKGGGIAGYGNSGSTSIKNSIVSGNVLSGTTTADDLSLFLGSNNSFISNGYNLIGDVGANITFAGTGDITDTLPSLAPLAANGGDTLTHALLFDSEAVDSGNCSSGPAADQRGVARPQDLNCDIGSYEATCFNTITVLNNQSTGSDSLRQAIADVCEGGLITFDNGLANDTIDISPDGQLAIYKSMTISGTVPITVSGNNAVRVFYIGNGNVTLDSLTIADGKSNGGGIDNEGFLTVANSTLIGNSGTVGGGIRNQRTMTVTNSILSGNSANSGGGIFNESTAIVVDSTLSGNSASSNGGGILDHGSLTVLKTTLSGNSAQSHGGGIVHTDSPHTLKVANSTLSGNSANFGGGISIYFGTATVHNSTIGSNRAVTSGGGIFNGDNDTVSTTISHTIVSGNIISGTTTADDLALESASHSGFTSGGYNLVGTIDADITSITETGDITGVNNPLLGPLADNGGETWTHALLPGSPAIDNGECSSGPAADQRSVARPQDSDCDTGAFESRGFSLTQTGGSPQSTPPNSLFASPLALTVSSAYSEPVEGGEITFSAPLSGAGVTFTETLAAIGGGGAVSLPVTANGTLGSYEVYADSAGNLGDELTYELANEFPSYLLTVSLDGSGGGTVNASGIDCYDGAGADCTQNYVEGTEVTLVATADAGSTFTGWSGGGCSGTGNCVVTMNAAKNVTATFTEVPPNEYGLTVSLAGSGSGTVTGSGINCCDGAGADCTQNYVEGTEVTLVATADTGSTFTGWSGGCSGTGNCVVTMSQTRSVTATFTSEEKLIFLSLVIR